MPVIDTPVHQKTVGGALYGCHNRADFAIGYLASLWSEPEYVAHTMSRECRYDSSLTDAKCEGCKHRGSSEEYQSDLQAAAGGLTQTALEC